VLAECVSIVAFRTPGRLALCLTTDRCAEISVVLKDIVTEGSANGLAVFCQPVERSSRFGEPANVEILVR
jgi:hypothetical protein